MRVNKEIRNAIISRLRADLPSLAIIDKPVRVVGPGDTALVHCQRGNIENRLTQQLLKYRGLVDVHLYSNLETQDAFDDLCEDVRVSLNINKDDSLFANCIEEFFQVEFESALEFDQPDTQLFKATFQFQFTSTLTDAKFSDSTVAESVKTMIDSAGTESLESVVNLEGTT